jgi:hypothetical protein
MDLPPADLAALDLDDRVFLLELAADELIGFEDRKNLFHPGEGLEGLIHKEPLVTDGADNGSFFPHREVGLEPQTFDAVSDLLDLLLA